jgi:hypothetical protein
MPSAGAGSEIDRFRHNVVYFVRDCLVLGIFEQVVRLRDACARASAAPAIVPQIAT